MMSRKIALMVCALALVCLVGVAFGAAVKVALTPSTDSPEKGATGQAVLNYTKGADKTEIQLNCLGLTPGAVYGVFLTEEGQTDVNLLTFVADGKGTGALHASVVGGDKSLLRVIVKNAGTAVVLQSRE